MIIIFFSSGIDTQRALQFGKTESAVFSIPKNYSKNHYANLLLDMPLPVMIIVTSFCCVIPQNSIFASCVAKWIESFQKTLGVTMRTVMQRTTSTFGSPKEGLSRRTADMAPMTDIHADSLEYHEIRRLRNRGHVIWSERRHYVVPLLPGGQLSASPVLREPRS